MGSWFKNWRVQAFLAVLAVGVVLGAPLATSNKAGADNVIIAGAKSLTDRVAVSYADAASVRINGSSGLDTFRLGFRPTCLNGDLHRIFHWVFERHFDSE